MKLRAVLLCTLCALFLQSCAILTLFKERDDFIRVQGTQFIHNGNPYYFAGTNFWYGGYLGSSGESGNRDRLRRELDILKANGVENLRVLAASEESPLRGSVKPALQRTPGDLDNALLEGLDDLLAEMAERGMHAVLYLNNFWEWSGGMAQYNVWADGGAGVDPEDTSKGWVAYMNFSATFYANQKANALFREYVRKIVTRKNTINGRTYSEDPTIMAWQLANEPRPGTVSPEGRSNLPAFYQWLDESAAYLHSLDTNHLVSSGSEGTVGCLQSEEYFLASHQSPHIDYLTFHVWALNWGWFNPLKFNETLPQSEVNALAYINKHILLARRLHKPLVMEEFGIGRDSGAILIGTPTTARDRYYRLVLGAVYDSARAGTPIAGSNFWAWGGEEHARHSDGMWRRGDPFVGDPPQEPQGLNSIFSTDTSTLAVIRSHAFRMMRLGVLDTLYARQTR